MESAGVTDDITVETNTPQALAVPPVATASVSPDQTLARELDDPGDEDDASDNPATPSKKPNRRDNPHEAVKSAIAKQRQAEREREDASQRADALARELQSLKAPPPDAPAPRYTRTKPSEDHIGQKYESYGDYVEDLTDWKVEQREAQYAEYQQRATIQQRHEQYAETFRGRIAQAEETDPAFWSKMSPTVVNLRPSTALQPDEQATSLNAIADVIFTSDASVDLMAHFSQHDRDLQRLSTLPPNMLFRELGRIEAQFIRSDAAVSGPASRASMISQAPAPIKPVGRAASSGDPLELSDDLDVDDYIRRANARDRKQARR